MKRRKLLRTGAATSAFMLAGCTGDSEEGVQDSDDDGVIDSEDYAPDDPTVQEKSDLKEVSSGTNRTTSDDTLDETDDTEDADTEDSSSDLNGDSNGDKENPPVPNVIEVQETEFDGDSHISSYSSSELTAIINPDDPTISGTALSGMEVRAIAATYPRDDIAGRTTDGASLSSGTKQSVTLSVDLGDAPIAEPLHYTLFLVPDGETIESANASDIIHLHESDPFELESDGITVQSSHVPELVGLSDDSGRNHTRTAKEGVVELTFDGSTNGRDWNVNFYTFKSAYVDAVRRDHGRSRHQFVSYEMESGFGWEVAELLKEEAEANGFTDKRMQVEFVIDFVQHLPYVPDDVSKGYDDYTKYTMETLTECGGDCEDSAILLASVLASDPFGYDMVLIQPTGHMAAGIKGKDDLPGYYWEYDGNKYYYIETTGVGWGIGDLPEEYRDSTALVHQV